MDDLVLYLRLSFSLLVTDISCGFPGKGFSYVEVNSFFSVFVVVVVAVVVVGLGHT